MITDAEKGHLQVGFKQSLRAIEEERALKAFLALDCDEKISTPLRNAAKKANVELIEVPSMKELGSICGIEVKASCAVILKF